ncbi:hypothetical protein BZA70DRAFT_285566 [Myxozyma melibiosi]|uniref:Wbp11/ELF5/Saf1 N-terminal domain-containing protein n=1 Tax=Myxozyma melibiosi TaxID=54550 RepID=A0ABR1EYD2_9ASCO
MAREKGGLNPAQAQHKKDKANAIKKAKAERAERMTEKLAQRNPERMEKQIQALKDLDSQGRLQGPDKKLLADLERQIVLVRQAKEKLQGGKGAVAQESERSGGARTAELDRHVNASGVFVLKGRERRSIYWDPVFNPTGLPPDGYKYAEWDQGEISDDESEVEDEIFFRPDLGERSAKGIPLPKGPALRYERGAKTSTESSSSSSSSTAPKTTYEAAPVVRDLKKESAAFVPASVQRMQQQRKRAGSFDEPVADDLKKIRHVQLEDEE